MKIMIQLGASRCSLLLLLCSRVSLGRHLGAVFHAGCILASLIAPCEGCTAVVQDTAAMRRVINRRLGGRCLKVVAILVNFGKDRP